jgi:hypothetical protein
MGTYNATYYYRTRDFANNRFISHSAFCQIIKETAKKYQIKLLERTFTRCYNELLWVLKKNVRRSYYNNDTMRCEIYDLDVEERSCAACLMKCDRRYRAIYKYKHQS